jgi:hypothetical protein
MPAATDFDLSAPEQAQLYQGEILLQSRLYSLWGGALTAQIYIPVSSGLVWKTLTQYDRWPGLFPPITKSVVVEEGRFRKCIHQCAQKQFSVLTIAVEADLLVREYPDWCIRFNLMAPNWSFREFEAEIQIKPVRNTGTILQYQVQAAAALPIPALFIQEAMRHDLPENLRSLRAYLQTL